MATPPPAGGESWATSAWKMGRSAWRSAKEQKDWLAVWTTVWPLWDLAQCGTPLGPLMGAGLVVSLQHLLAQSPLGNWVSVILGIIFVVCVLSFRSGIIGELAKMYRKNFK